jgi:hypothetical protein
MQREYNPGTEDTEDAAIIDVLSTSPADDVDNDGILRILCNRRRRGQRRRQWHVPTHTLPSASALSNLPTQKEYFPVTEDTEDGTIIDVYRGTPAGDVDNNTILRILRNRLRGANARGNGMCQRKLPSASACIKPARERKSNPGTEECAPLSELIAVKLVPIPHNWPGGLIRSKPLGGDACQADCIGRHRS